MSVTSSDGFLTVTAQPTYASVLVAVNFTGASGISAGNTILVTRTATDSNGVTSTQRVRGLDRLRAPGGVSAGWDAEAPLGVALTYQATAYNAAGTVIVTSTTATLTSPAIAAPTGQVWLKHLTSPILSQLVGCVYPDWMYGIAQGVFTVIGRSDPIVKSDVRQLPSGTMTVKVSSAATLTALLALLNADGPYLMQAPAFGDSDQYVSVGAITAQRFIFQPGAANRMIPIPLTVVARPATTGSRVAVPGHTYADSLTRWPLYSNRSSTYLTRITT